MHPDPNFDISRFFDNPETGRSVLLSMVQGAANIGARHITSIITALLTAAAVAGLQYVLVIPRLEEREVRTDARLTKLEVRADRIEANDKKAEVTLTEMRGIDQLVLERVTNMDRRLSEHMQADANHK